MAKITQEGYKFHYSSKSGKVPIEQEWGLERVAAYMCVIEACRILSQRYEQARFYCNKLGMTLYELENLDTETRKDLNTLTNKFLADVLDTAQHDPNYLGRPLPAVLDTIEQEIIDGIEDCQAPIEAFGETIVPEKLLTRPTEQEYEKRLQERIEEHDKLHAKITEQINSSVVSKHVKIVCGNYTNMCVVKKQNDKYIYVDVYDDGGAVIHQDMRVPVTSSRIVSLFY